MAKIDEKTLDLIKLVKSKREEISNAEKPNWKTNCSFQLYPGTAPVNLHVENDIGRLVNIVAYLMQSKEYYDKAEKLLGVSAPTFTLGGFTDAEWIDDIKTRICKIQLNSKKKQLESLEARLNSIMSPELRAELELAAIEEELKQ